MSMMQFIITDHFKRQLKPLFKKFPSLKDDLIRELLSFDQRRAISLGHGTYKIRVSCKDLRKGKSGGFRVIILVIEIDILIAPLAIYFKGEREGISKEEILFHAAIIQKEIEG